MKHQNKQTSPTKNIVRVILLTPWLTSLLCVIAFFILYLFVFRPGYQVDDDITMIQIASGYLGGKPVPFLVFSNVILGFFLNLLYRLPTNLNWEILIFLGINLLSVWCLNYIVLTLPLKTVYKFFAILVILLSDSLFLLNITFTTTAAFAVLAGVVSILAAVNKRSPLPRRMLVFGSLLILAGSLIRIESFLLVLLLISPSLGIMFRFFDIKNLALGLIPTVLVVASFYFFNAVYVKSSPQWNSFYSYNDARSQLQDTPRVHLSNVKDAYIHVGWDFNDYKLFMNWFFPDEQLYSISKLQYLVAHIPGTEKNVISAAISYFYPKPFFDDTDSFPYFFMIAAGLIALAAYPSLRKAIWPVVVLLLTFLVLIFYLIWTQKVPVRVWDSFLATISIFGLFILLWAALNADLSDSQKKHIFAFVAPALLCVASLFALYYAVITTRLNVQRQAVYQNVLSDIQTLQAQGKIQSHALIISPAIGIPLVWSNPMVLDLPSAQYLEMGWLTFSPSYYSVLQGSNVQSLPAGFYQSNHVYLMVKANLLDSVIEYIFDHKKVVVVPQLIYASPNHDFDTTYNNIKLYKLILQK